MNDIDDWLNSLGLDNSQQESHSTDNIPIVPDPQQPQEAEPSNTPLSEEDINGILAENGFEEPVYDNAEEVTDEDEYDENCGEGRDLDAEEDADWDDAIASGALQVVQRVNEEDYPEHNPDEETVQVSIGDQSAEVPVVHEQVSENALEAFNAIAETEASPTQEPLILPNSPTLLLNNATSRFSGTEWYNEIQKQRVILAGLGGIGSYVSYNLARMNIAALFMYDDDVVEQANMSGQLYCIDDIGKAKVDAMADMIKSYTTMRNIYAIKDKFKDSSEAGDVMICGFDNMAARNTFFHAWRKHLRDKSEEEKRKCLYLDGRLSINTLQVFCITGDNDWAISEYMEKYLFSDAQAEETQCSLKQTTYLACMIGSMIVNLFTNWTANLLNPIIPYDLPFFTEYDAQNMIFKTIK